MMDATQIAYLTFGFVLLLAVIFDLGLLSKKDEKVSLKKALLQTIFWVMLALVFWIFLWWMRGEKTALEYVSAYLMEWSLSIDNIFVFILIFTFFKVKESYYGQVLMIGILTAVLLRILFITVGVALVASFHELLYVFGAILVYTGLRMFFARKNEKIQLADNQVYKWLKRLLPLTTEDAGGRFTTRIGGKKFYTSIFVVVILLASADIIFAIDSIPAVFGITQEKLVIYTSNIFAILGLRSLFFLLRGAVDRFGYLQQGIAVVLIFIGIKMLAEIFKVFIPVYISLLVILACIATAITISMTHPKKEELN